MKTIMTVLLALLLAGAARAQSDTWADLVQTEERFCRSLADQTRTASEARDAGVRLTDAVAKVCASTYKTGDTRYVPQALAEEQCASSVAFAFATKLDATKAARAAYRACLQREADHNRQILQAR
jgi:hypothetical protein